MTNRVTPAMRSAMARRAALIMHAKHGNDTAVKARAVANAIYDTPEKRRDLAMKAAAASAAARKKNGAPRGVKLDIQQALRHLRWMREELDALEQALQAAVSD